MDQSRESYWQIQKTDQPVFKDLIWSKPQNAKTAGKLLVIGGNDHGFSSPAKAYSVALKAGVGSIRVVLPDSLKHGSWPANLETIFCPSTPSGSLAKNALAEILDQAAWSDLVLLAGDFGRNSETAMLLEALVTKYKAKLCLTRDGLDYFTDSPAILLNRPETLIVGSLAQLQKMTIKACPEVVVTYEMGLVKLVEAMHEISQKFSASLIVRHQANLIAASDGKVSTTKLIEEAESWRLDVATFASVWWLQNPTQPYAAVTTGIVEYLTDK